MTVDRTIIEMWPGTGWTTVGARLDYEQGSGPYTVTLMAPDTSGQTASVRVAIIEPGHCRNNEEAAH